MDHRGGRRVTRTLREDLGWNGVTAAEGCRIPQDYPRAEVPQ